MPLHALRRHERGQALVEYATVIALVGVCLAAILGLVGNATKKAFEHTSSTVDPHASQPVVGGGGGSGGVRGMPGGAPADPDSVEVPDGPKEDEPDTMTIAHQPR